ncbi:16S rRNA (guanine(966)-N(2))-methyltransferase RsmD [bacterium]|nr:16S rRNA (guanine(966)-N(2))-methyltransferase RsmD [bacterium]
MQITGGKDRGRKIKPANNPAIRPSKAVVREALFSILGIGCCSGKRVADLFAGSGIFTLEALSRGALTSYSVDKDPVSCDIIRSNFALLNVAENAKIMQMSVTRAINEFAKLNLQFDIVFLDPPYHIPQLGAEAIDQSARAGILSPDAVVIFEHRSKIDIPEIQTMTIWKQKKYGQSMLSFYELSHLS